MAGSTPPLTPTELRQMALRHLYDAEALFGKSRYHGAYYYCGYVVEFLLKARICRTLRWADFPNGVKWLQVHDLAFLLKLSGLETRVKSDPVYSVDWQIVVNWTPEIRYSTAAKTRIQAREMLDATKSLRRALR